MRPQDCVGPQRWSDRRVLAVAERVTPYAMPIPEGDPAMRELTRLLRPEQ